MFGTGDELHDAVKRLSVPEFDVELVSVNSSDSQIFISFDPEVDEEVVRLALDNVQFAVENAIQKELEIMVRDGVIVKAWRKK